MVSTSTELHPAALNPSSSGDAPPAVSVFEKPISTEFLHARLHALELLVADANARQASLTSQVVELDEQIKFVTHERDGLKEEVRALRREVSALAIDFSSRDAVPTADQKGRRRFIRTGQRYKKGREEV